ncbi:unnamed protein product [Mytilus edulis]|uniref:DNA-directed DNA polymerase n=1 Tax=Mytilus edulis TaxID=6550 RepID=A0A8S3PNL4_MYTED|nr:unnamed protein product [Mytilus edulis]
MLLMFVKATRGGVSQISHRHGKANHKYMSHYDTTQPTKYLTYLDANNLYGWAMSELLPTHKLKWREPEDVETFYNGKMIMIWDKSRNSFLKDLNMIDNHITNLKSPSHGMNVATKRWVMKQVKDNTTQMEVQSECNLMKTDIKRLEKGYDATIKELERKSR